MFNYLVISKDSNKILNVIIWDGISSYTPPDNTYLEIQTDPYIQVRNAVLINGVWTLTDSDKVWL